MNGVLLFASKERKRSRFRSRSSSDSSSGSGSRSRLRLGWRMNGVLPFASKERKRSRSRSRSSSDSSSGSGSRSRLRLGWRLRWRSRSRSMSRSRSGSPLLDTTLPDTFHIVYQCGDEDGGTKLWLVSIPTNQLQFFHQNKPGCFVHHDHNLNRTVFRTMDADHYLSYLGKNDRMAFCRLIVVGCYAYNLFGVDLSTDLDWRCYVLDDDSPPLQLSPPLCPTRYFCTALSMRGKIYLFGGLAYRDYLPTESFAEVYDPTTGQWSEVPQPPNPHVLITRHNLFVASLGDSKGKILVYDYDTPTPMFYIYNVAAEKWISRRPPSYLGFEPEYILNKAIINQHDGNLYWIDLRCCFLYCFDLKTMEVFSGPIVGLDHERPFIDLQSLSGVKLVHLWGDFFCLIWCTFVHSLPPYLCPHNEPTTEYHFTFMRAVKGPSRGLLRAFVLGCFMDSYFNRPFISDASTA